MEKLKNLFNVTTVNDEVEEEFYNFFIKWNLLALTTDSHRTATIKVTDSDARSVINNGGAYNKELKNLTELMEHGRNNNSFDFAIFSLIEGVKSFQKFMNNVKKINNYIQREIMAEHQYNRWNIVYYAEDLR